MTRLPQRERASEIWRRLEQAHPDAHCALDHRTALELLVATILSAQCTDARVNQVTPSLFRRYRSARAFAGAAAPDLEVAIRSTGFYRNKAKSIRGACDRLVTEFGGKVPRTMEELLTLPGVARKTANVVLGVAYGIPSGIVVDTHVKRVAYRLGLTRQTDPVKVEQSLLRLVPEALWIDVSHQIIFHGRRICQARRPSCAACPLLDLCPQRGLDSKQKRAGISEEKKPGVREKSAIRRSGGSSRPGSRRRRT